MYDIFPITLLVYIITDYLDTKMLRFHMCLVDP